MLNRRKGISDTSNREVQKGRPPMIGGVGDRNDVFPYCNRIGPSTAREHGAT